MAGGAFWTRWKTEGLEGCLSDCFTCLGGRGEVEKWGQPKSSLLCVSVETTKATKRRSYPFCVSVSWETAGRSCILVLLFSPLRAINRWAHVALCSVTYTGLEPSNPGSSDSHMNRGRSRPPRMHFPQHMSGEKSSCVRVCCCYFYLSFDFWMYSTHTVNSGSKATSEMPWRDAQHLVKEGRRHHSLVCLHVSKNTPTALF